MLLEVMSCTTIQALVHKIIYIDTCVGSNLLDYPKRVCSIRHSAAHHCSTNLTSVISLWAWPQPHAMIGSGLGLLNRSMAVTSISSVILAHPKDVFIALGTDRDDLLRHGFRGN